MTAPDILVPVPAAPSEPTTPIRPSEALRLGRLLRPRRIEGSAYDGEDGACAVGSITKGGLGIHDWGNEDVDCPALDDVHAGHVHGPAFGITAHLNDHHHWSDDQIVAWLQTMGL